jgi:uncharacterized protein YbcI
MHTGGLPRAPVGKPQEVERRGSLRLDSGLDHSGVTTYGGSGEILADISRSMVRLYKECYGKGPNKARSYMSGDLVVCLLEGGFAPAELTLRDAGRGDAVSDQRDVLHGVLRNRFVETIEELTGRRVHAFISGVDLETEMNAELFVLEPAEPEAGDEREAMNAWAEETRQQSRVLRGERA